MTRVYRLLQVDRLEVCVTGQCLQEEKIMAEDVLIEGQQCRRPAGKRDQGKDSDWINQGS